MIWRMRGQLEGKVLELELENEEKILQYGFMATLTGRVFDTRLLR